jgi:hypothetical protein
MKSYLLGLGVDQHVRVELNMGKLSQEKVLLRSLLRQLPKTPFAVRSFSRPERGVRRQECREQGCSVHIHSKDKGVHMAEKLRALSDEVLEMACILLAMDLLGRQARHSGARFYIRIVGGERKDVVSDNLVGLATEAGDFLGENEGSLCIEGAWKGYRDRACNAKV